MVIVPVANPDGYYVSVVGRGRVWLLVHLCCFICRRGDLIWAFFFSFLLQAINETH